MKIAYNPLLSPALSTAPSGNDITFDLPGISIYSRGIRFKGTDTTYNVFKKHTSSGSGGYNGLVPIPSFTVSSVRYLREDGTWLIPSPQTTYTLLRNEDLNSLLEEGRWYFISESSATTNGPTGINNGAELYIGRNAGGYRYQKVITAPGIIWFRYWDNISWYPWTRWYTDANTDKNVLQSVSVTSNFRPLILGSIYNTDPAVLTATTTDQVYTANALYVLSSTASLFARTFVGALKGNADTSTSLGDINVGNPSLPVYFSAGKPIACIASSLFSVLANDSNQISVTVAGQNRKLTVGYASEAWYLVSSDTRTVSNTPSQFSSSSRFEFKANATDGLNDGGYYHGILHFKPYGGTTDFSSGQTQQLGFTDASNLWIRTSTSATAWGTWHKFLNTANSSLTVTTDNITIKINNIATTLPTTSFSDDRYVNVTGDTMTGGLIISTPNYEGLLTINRAQSKNNSVIKYTNSDGVLGSVGICGSAGAFPNLPMFNDSAAKTYMLLHTGNYTPTLDTRYVKKAGDTMTGRLTLNADILNNGWYISVGGVGWYSESYGGGIHMIDSDYVRIYNNKCFLVANNVFYAINNSGGYYSNWSNTIGASDWAGLLNYQNSGVNGSYKRIPINGVHRMLGWADEINGQGYTTRYCISSYRTSAQFGHMMLSVGNNETGTSGNYLSLAGNGTMYWTGAIRAESGFIHSGYNSSTWLLRSDGGAASFAWSGLGGLPTWLWGGNAQHNYYLYNPSNFRVLYATSAGRADLLGSYGLSPNNSHPGHGARVFFSWDLGQAHNNTTGYSNGITIGANPSDTSYGFQIVLNMWDDRTYTRRYNSGWQAWKTLAWTTDILNPTDYYWANIRTSASSSTSTSPTFNTAYASNWFRSTGYTGWYSESYGGGIHMIDSDYVRIYNNKKFYCENTSKDSINVVGGLYSHGAEGFGLTVNGTESTTSRIYGQIGSPVFGIIARYEVLWYGNKVALATYRGGSSDISSMGITWNNICHLRFYPSGAVDTDGRIQSPGFVHTSIKSDAYVLLAGGGYKIIDGVVPGQIISLYTTSKITDLFTSRNDGVRGRSSATIVVSGTSYTVDLSKFVLLMFSEETVIGIAPSSWEFPITRGENFRVISEYQMPAHRHYMGTRVERWGDNGNDRNFVDFQGSAVPDGDYNNDPSRFFTRYAGAGISDNVYQWNVGTLGKTKLLNSELDMKQRTYYTITMVYKP